MLSKLIHQSYHAAMDSVPLSGTTPLQMLLEIGLDKLKKDYISFFVSEYFSNLKLSKTCQLPSITTLSFYLPSHCQFGFTSG